MKKKIIKYFLILGCVALLVLTGLEIKKYQKTKPLCKNCDVLLISIDTLSAKHLPCYGYDKNTAPNLCQFGKDNVLFSNSYAQSYWTRPSQTSVLTGLHPSTHGVLVAHADKLDKKYKTIAEALKVNNYQTIYSGTPLDDGSWPPSVIRGFDYLFEQDYKTGKMLDHWYRALDILEKNKKSKTPTFMYLHTYYVHAPYLTGKENLKFVSEENRKKYSHIPLNKEDYRQLTQEKRDFVLQALEYRVANSDTKESLEINTKMLNDMKATKTLEEAKKVFLSWPEYEIEGYVYDWYMTSLSKLDKNEYVASLYDEKINQMDNEMKNFLNQIDKKFNKNTVVVIYSDHGEVLGERGGFGHCDIKHDCLYNETMKVPLMIKIPGIKNKKINDLAQGIDIYPTILKIIGMEPPSEVEGDSLVEIIKSKFAKPEKKYIVSEQDDLQKAVVDKKWKLYFKDYGNIKPENIELYDLENDLYEQKNVAKDNPEIVKEKIDQLNEFVENSKNNLQNRYNFPDWIDKVKREELIQGGYF